MLSDLKAKINSNWKSGITVALVSIPLSVSLAVASQSTPVAGIITAIWAGLVASLFGGSNYNIVGPTGALSGLIAAFVIANGVELLPSLAIVTGFIVIAAYLIKAEKYLVLIPASTIHGFTLAVAFIIALNQANSALGITGLKVHERFIENVLETAKHLGLLSIPTFIVFLIFLVAMFAFAKYTPKLPGAIVLAPIGIALGYLSQSGNLPFQLQTLGMKYTMSPALFAGWKFIFSSDLFSTALVIALIAILETMISAKIADGMTKTKHEKRREMLALGLANIVTGLAGGIPATAALARTSLNIKSKATHKISATISSVSIAIISLILLSYFKYIPMAVIAAILVFVAARMIEVHNFKRMYKMDRASFYVALLVAAVSIYQDPIIGILLGVAISLIMFVEKLSKGQFELIVNSIDNGIEQKIVGYRFDGDEMSATADTLVYTFQGILAYMNGLAHVSRFEKDLAGYKNVILRFRGVHFIDMDGVDAFDEIIEVVKTQGKKVLVTGVNPLISEMLEHSDDYRKLQKDGMVFEKTADALSHLGYNLSGKDNSSVSDSATKHKAFSKE
jgi:SulP family sulfate permease